MRGERGFALVLTLVVTALMVALTAELIHQVSVDTSLSRDFRDGQQASLLAASGIDAALKLLQVSQPGQSPQQADMWAQPITRNDEVGSIGIRVVDETGKINLNQLIGTSESAQFVFTNGVLQQLGTRLGIPEDCWAALAEWVNPEGHAPLRGVGKAYYQSQHPPYTPRYGPLFTLDELSLIKGFTPEIIAKLRPFVTIYPSNSGISIAAPRININTAPIEVVAALINDNSENYSNASKLIEKRPFKNVGEVLQISGGQLNLTNNLQTFGTAFRITSVARVNDSARTIDAVYSVSPNGMVAPPPLSWQEY